MPVEIEIELRAAVPPWENGDLLPEASACSRSRTRARRWAAPLREPCRGELSGCEPSTRSTAAAADPPAGSAGARSVTWQSALFPSGRVRLHRLPAAMTDSPTYNEGYLFAGPRGDAPWRRRTQPERRTSLSCPRRGTTHPGRVGDVELHRHGRRRQQPGVPGAAAGDHPLHLGRRVGQRDDGTLDARTATRYSAVWPAARASMSERQRGGRAASTRSSSGPRRRPASTSSAATPGARASRCWSLGRDRGALQRLRRAGVLRRRSSDRW